MYSLEQIKQHASTNTIYTEVHPDGVRGFIHWTGKQAIYCLPVGAAYTWRVDGQRVRESEVRHLLSVRPQ